MSLPIRFPMEERISTAIAQWSTGCRLLEDGADIVDVGGESTRPGAKVLPSTESAATAPAGLQPQKRPVSEQEELQRVIPVIAALKQKRPEAVISVDTYKAKRGASGS